MSRVGELAMQRHEDAVERRARELCLVAGLDPNALCWEDYKSGIRTWWRWQEFAEQAEEQLRVGWGGAGMSAIEHDDKGRLKVAE